MGYDQELNINAETTEQTEQKDNTEVIAMQDKYLAGIIDKDSWILFVAAKIKGYYESLYRLNHMAGYVEHEDYEQQCLEMICKKIDKYDARKSTLTTFFKTKFLEAFNTVQKDSGKANSRHYEKQIKYLTRVAQQYGYDGILDPRLTPEKLSKLAGSKEHSLKTVIETRKYLIGNSVSSLDDVTENHDFESPYKDPAVIYLKNEQSEEVSSAVERLHLTSFEEFLIENHIKDDGLRLKTKEVIRYLRDYAKDYPDDEVFGMDVRSFNSQYVNSRSSLLKQKLYSSLKKFAPVKENNVLIESPVLASDEDLKKAFDLGDLF